MKKAYHQFFLALLSVAVLLLCVPLTTAQSEQPLSQSFSVEKSEKGNGTSPNSMSQFVLTGQNQNDTLCATLTADMTETIIITAQTDTNRLQLDWDDFVATINLSCQGHPANMEFTIEQGAFESLLEAGIKKVIIRSSILEITLDDESIALLYSEAADDVAIYAVRVLSSSLDNQIGVLIGPRPCYTLELVYGPVDETVTAESFCGIEFGFVYAIPSKESPKLLSIITQNEEGAYQFIDEVTVVDKKLLLFKPVAPGLYGVAYGVKK